MTEVIASARVHGRNLELTELQSILVYLKMKNYLLYL